MAARKSRKKKTAEVPVTEAEETPTPEEIEVTQSEPEAAVAEDTSTAPAEPAEPTAEDKEASEPAAKKRGITVSRPMPNAQAPSSEEVPADEEPAGPDKFRPIDIKHPAWVPGEPRVVTVMRNLRTGEVVFPARLQALVEAAEEN